MMSWRIDELATITMRPALFAFLADDHPLRLVIDPFEAELRKRSGAGSLPEAPARRTVHAHVSTEPGAEGPRVNSLYWSIQHADEGGFAAGTLYYTGVDGATEWLKFPTDPRLPALAEYVQSNPCVEVLRYMPQRRITLRLGAPSGRAIVAKLKRASRFRQAWTMLRVVERRVSEARPSFRVPGALGLDEGRCLYLQEAMPGRNLSALLDEHTAPVLLARLGALHRELHALPAVGLPQRDAATSVHEARANAAWIDYLLPSLRGAAAQMADVIGHFVPAAAPAFCHGDPDCGQVVVDGESWSLLDFDSCHAGDPYRDIAMLAASLDYHAPHLRALAEGESEARASAVERAADAYLDGYFGGAARDTVRLAWNRACAQLYYLALVLSKDRFHPLAFTRRWRRLESHAVALGWVD
jgi:aminoglycoside phosphotransferase (APT) family kinase protein